MFLGFFFAGQAQNEPTIRHSKGQLLGKSSPLTTWKFKTEGLADTYSKKKGWKDAVNGIPNFKGHTKFPYDETKQIFPKGADPVIQSGAVKTVTEGITILQDYDGIDFNDANIWPPDCNGDIGLQYYIMTTNGGNGTILHVYDKVTGDLVEETTMSPLWTELGATGAGDPVIWFDRFEDRWFLTEFTFNNSMLVAVSETSDPLGSYSAWEFVAPTFPDYPKFGSWDDAIYITTNEYNGTPGFNPVYALDRDAMIAGESTVAFVEFDAMSKFGDGNFFQVSSPIDYSGTMMPEESTNFMAIRIADDQWDGVDSDMLQYFEFIPDFEDPGNSSVEGPFEFIVEPFKSDICNGGLFDCVEMTNGATLSAIPTVIMNKVQYRNFGDYESILLNFSVDITGDNEPGVRWYELRKTGDEDWSIYQESTFTLNDGISRFMGSMSQDSKGNILLAYAMAGKETDPGVGVTGRRVSDPPGMMTFGETIIIEGEQASPIFRWGDYFSVTLDPQDDATFWLTSEYMPSDQDWSTRLTSMSIRRDSFDAQVSQLISPVTGSMLSDNETVTIKVTNPGYKAVQDVPWTVFFEGNMLESGVISGTIEPLESVDVVLTATADLSAFGAYDFLAYTSLEGDENPANDTLRAIVNNVAAIDLMALGDNNNLTFTCSETVDVNARYINLGLEEVVSFDAELYVDDVLTETIAVTTSMQMNQEETVLFTGVPVVTGFNTIRYEASNINGMPDQVLDNNAYEYEVEVLSDAINANLSFMSDGFAGETSWTITDLSGTILYSGSGYTGTEANEDIDLCFQEDCYIFTLEDGFGDGWGSFNGDEFLEITQDDGQKVVILEDFNFGSSWSMEFCLPATCEIEAEVEYEDASAPGINDAAIFINFPGGDENAMYSIDGGETFQSNPLFTNLVDGEYNVVVVDKFGCTWETTVNVAVGIEDLENEITFTVNPNPSLGMLNVHIDGYDGDFELNMDIIDQSGKRVGSHRITKFSDGYRTTLLIPNLPSGMYYLSVGADEMQLMRKFIKQ